MASPPFEEESTRGLRLFLVGVRLVGLLTAVLLSGAHTAPVAMQEQLKGFGTYLTLGIIFYHVVAGALSMKVEKALAALLILLDVGVGVVMTFLFGEPYFLLVFTLPILELAAFFGYMVAWGAAFLGAFFYGAIYGYPLTQQWRTSEDPGILLNQLKLIGVQGVLSVLLIWLYSLAVAEIERRREMTEEAAQQKDLLYEAIQEKRAEVGKMYGVVGERQAEVQNMSEEMNTLREELELAYRDLAQAKLTLNRRESALEETQARLSEELEGEKHELERQVSRLKRGFETRSRLLEIFSQIAASLSLDETLLALVFHLQSLFTSKTCVIFVVDEVDGHVQLFPEVADSPHTDYFRNLVLQMGQEAPGWAAANNRSLKIDNEVALVDGYEVRTLPGQGLSAMVAPLSTDIVHGAVYLGRDEANGYTPDDLNFLTEFCRLAGLAVGNALEFKNRISRGLHDPVTQLYNGLFLEERMKEEVRRGRRYTYPVSLLIVDIDNFNSLVEQAGEAVAEEILREMSHLIRDAIRETDVPARVEGDDFAILLVHSDRHNALAIGERIRASVAAREFGPHRSRLSVSVGVAGTPHDASTDEHLRLRAYGALETARGQGGNRASFYEG